MVPAFFPVAPHSHRWSNFMYKSVAGLLGVASALSLVVPAQAASSVQVSPAAVSLSGFDPSAVQDVQYYHHWHHWHRHWHHWHRRPVVVIRPY
jgi:hypothetical protein